MVYSSSPPAFLAKTGESKGPATVQPKGNFMEQFNNAIKKLGKGDGALARKAKSREKYAWPHFQRDAPKIVRLYIPVLVCVLFVTGSVAYLDYYRVPMQGFTGKDILPRDDLRMIEQQHQRPPSHPQWQAVSPPDKATEPAGVLSHIWVIVGLIAFIFIFLLGGTVLLLVLYRSGHSQSIQIVSSVPYLVYLAVFPLVYIQELVFTLNVAVDWISVLLFLYNQTAAGFVVLFYAGPNWAKKVFYVVVSAMLALFMVKFMNQWIEIALMVLLICWDLYAVLHTTGPLIGLLNALQSSKGNDLPPVVFQMTAWHVPSEPYATIPQTNLQASLPPSPIERFELGLGDFIFYSILVAKSFIYAGPLGALFATIFVIIGLTITLLVLIVTDKALPAIPIPVTLGLLAQLVSTYLSGPLGEKLNSAMIQI